MNRARIVWAANSVWGSVLPVAANHLAARIAARGHQVAFISEPVSPWHLLKPGSHALIKPRLASWLRRGGRDCGGRLFHYAPFTLAPPQNLPVLRSTWVLENWHRLTLPRLESVLKAAGFGEPDLLVLDTVPHAAWRRTLNPKRILVRLTDRLEGWAKTTGPMLELEAELIREADGVTYSARTLEEKVLRAGVRRALYLPNGVDYARFARDDLAPPPEYRAFGKAPVVVYAGAIEVWFDWDLVFEAARRLPHAAFVLIGPVGCRPPARPPENVHILGPRPHSALPAYLRHARCGILPFDVQRHGALVHAVHPLKLYEYLAAGLPAVAVEWDELRSMASPAVLVRNAAEFTSAVDAALRKHPPLESHRAYAKANDWSLRAERFLDFAGIGFPADPTLEAGAVTHAGGRRA